MDGMRNYSVNDFGSYFFIQALTKDSSGVHVDFGRLLIAREVKVTVISGDETSCATVTVRGCEAESQ